MRSLTYVVNNKLTPTLYIYIYIYIYTHTHTQTVSVYDTMALIEEVHALSYSFTHS
jgi:hypothetical protein